MAGFEVNIIGQGVEVLGLAAESLAQGQLHAGDLIVGLKGEPVRSVDELIGRLGTFAPGDVVALRVRRGDAVELVQVPLMPPAEPGGAPRIGISVRTAGEAVDLPVPIAIRPKKVVGGPSAGLMFTLTIYNLITPEDLTGL